MRVEIVEDDGDEPAALRFPPEGDYQDLRENPRAIDGIAAARRYLPLRNFLAALNSPDSLYCTASATTKSDSPAAISAGLAHEFASQVSLVFADPAFNADRSRFTELSRGLKDLLERDPTDAVRAALRISSCNFPRQNRIGFCLSIRVVAVGESAAQTELRWGLALARVQQALLFRGRALKQQVDA